MRFPPYLITSLNRMPGAERWVAGVRDILGDSVQPVILMWEPAFPVPPGWIVRRMGCRYPGHLHKLLPILELGLDPERWFVFTDGSDVLFQTPLPELERAGHRVLLSAEGVRHADCSFWGPHLRLPWFASLADRPIYNVGSWAAVGHAFLAFVRMLRDTADALRGRGLPLVDVHEQLLYNLWVQAHREECGELPGLFCTLYANLQPDGPARLEGGRLLDPAGRPYSIVHGNGDTKPLLDRLEPPARFPAAAGLRTGE